MKIRADSLFLLILLTVMCAACAAPSSPTIQTVAVPSPASSALPSIEPTVLYGGEEGATCMATVLSSRVPGSDPRVSTFQNFDVVYSVLEFMSDTRPFRVNVVSALQWKSRNKIEIPFAASELARFYQRDYMYYFEERARPSLAAIGQAMDALILEWEKVCDVGPRVLFFTGVP